MKKTLTIFVLLAVLLSATPAHALTLGELKIEIEKLKTEIVGLKNKLTGQAISTAPVTTYYKGMTSPAIIPFQQALINLGLLASGNAIGTFGPLTYAAVLNFQKANSLTLTGALDPNTQQELNASGGGEDCEAQNDLWGYDSSTDAWTQKASMPVVGRKYAAAFSIGDRGYVGTGIEDGGAYKKDFWEWNQDTNTWTQKADFAGGERWSSIGFSIGYFGYVGTGSDGSNNIKKDFWEYDPATNIWIEKSSMITERVAAVGFSIGNKGYIGTGRSSIGLLGDFWEWDRITDAWIQKADLPGLTRSQAVGFGVGNYGYIGTGSTEHGNVKDFWEWDSANNAWTQKADFAGGGRAEATGFSTLGNQKGYLGLGISGINSDSNKDFWEYDPATNKWTQKANFVSERYGAVGFSIRDYGYIATGYGCTCSPNTWTQKANFGGVGRSYASGFSIGKKGYVGLGVNATSNPKDFWEYDQDTNVWTQKADFGGGFRVRAVGFSIGSKGYIGTGSTSFGSPFGANDFWEWDQSTNTWTQKANLAGSPRFGAVGFSIGDRGYITTGKVGGSIYLKDLWEYNPTADSWTQKADFGGSARVSAAAFSLDGKGYVGTGLPNDTFGDPVKDFWEYDPVTNKWAQKADFGGAVRHEAAGFSIGKKGYIGTGQSDVSIVSDFWAYDPGMNTWTRKANHGGGQKANGVGYSIGSKGYISTGSPGSNTHWEYCPD